MLTDNDRLMGYMPGMIIVHEKETAKAFDKKRIKGVYHGKSKAALCGLF